MKQLAETNWHELPEPEVVRLLESVPTFSTRTRQARTIVVVVLPRMRAGFRE